jgi:hypothetical protein
MPTVVDNCYNSNPVFFRINKSKRFIKGGTQIEVPLMYSRFTNGGAYEGLDVLTISPSDTIKNGVWDWRQYYVSVAVDGRTLIKVDSPEAIANFLKLQFAQAEMEMAANLGADLWGTNTAGSVVGAGKQIDGIPNAVDGSTTYGGLTTAANPWWAAQEYAGTEALSLDILNSKLWSAASEGGRHPTLIVSRQQAYDSYYKLAVSKQNIYQGPVSYDEQLFAGGFTNLLFNGIPWTTDPNVPNSGGTIGSDIYLLNEDYIYWCISPRGDMFVTDFQEGINQDAMVAKILWAGNLVVTNRARHAKAVALAPAA